MKKTVQLDGIPCPVPEDHAEDIATLAKSHPFQRKNVVCDVKDFDQSERTDISTITSDALDRDNEIVLPDGIYLEDFRSNPVVLFNHEQGYPCGKALWIKTDGNRLVMKTYYPPRPEGFEGEWLPDKCFALAQAGILVGKSIGFLAEEIRDPTDEELARYPTCERVISKARLMEVSCVTVPCNPEALLEAISKGLIKLNKVGNVKKPEQPKPVKKPKQNKPKAKPVKAGPLVIELDVDAIAEQVMANLGQDV